MKRRDWLMFVVGVAFAAALAVIGWFAYSSAKRQAEEARARLAAEAEQTRIEALRDRMRPVEIAVKKYYLENGVWPEDNNLQLVAPYLEQGRVGLLDPWGKAFTMQIVAIQDETDGTYKERPQIVCRTPTGEEIRYPEKAR